MKLPKYSVIMSIYHKVNPEHLKESIQSILTQTYKPDEFIIVKDGELTKKQEELLEWIVKKNINLFRIIEFKQNKGAGEAYKEAITKAKNTYAAIMDSDDIAVTNKFESQMKFLKKHPEIDILGSNACEFISKPDNIMSIRTMPENHEEIVNFGHGRCPLIQPTAIFKKKSVIDSGSYQTSELTEDYDLYIRMIQNGCRFHNYQEILVYVRTSEDFFKRRGGLKYSKKIIKFKYKHYKTGFFTAKQFIKTGGASLIVSIMPNFLRSYIYNKFLRG